MLARQRASLKFVLVIGVLSFFADCTYEGARSITGPFLGLLGASAFTISAVAGVGELLGHAWRLASGTLSEITRKFWPITIVGYTVQMVAVPLLAFARTWQEAAALIILERVGRATRNPPRDVMLSVAAEEIGYGWAFGVHEALDQSGALAGPLIIAAILATQGAYQQAFAVLVVPALTCLFLLCIARIIYPRPETLASRTLEVRTRGIPPLFWLYLSGAILVAAGFADFSLISYRFHTELPVSNGFLPVFYAIAMAASGAGSLTFGRLFDRFGLVILVPLTVVAACATPLVFLGSFWLSVLGSALWGMSMGVHESIIPAAVSTMVAREHRASAFGIFTAAYGVAWFAGSLVIGIFYTRSLVDLVAFCVALQLIAVPIFIRVARRLRPQHRM
ncbi:MAG TPA: MFS transporter [Candidatus Baltobacteraceae bacterium]